MYSLLLTRGLDQVIRDMESSGFVPPMIGHHDYASQEMVNLLLNGVAHPNVFNGNRRLEDETGRSDDIVVLRGKRNSLLYQSISLILYYYF